MVLCALALDVAAPPLARAAAPDPLPADTLRLRSDDRILVLAPHPDDEVAGCGGVLQQAAARGLAVRVVFFTHGDDAGWKYFLFRKHPVFSPGAFRRLGETRHDEAVRACARLGVPDSDLVFLGYPDAGTLEMFTHRWNGPAASRGPLTRSLAVPYPDALRPGARYTGEEALLDMERVMRAFRPTRIFVSHPADHHPDHVAMWLFARAALWELGDTVRAGVHPYLVHYRDWPRPDTYLPGEPMAPPPSPGAAVSWSLFPLDTAVVRAKELALREHHTQFATGPGLLSHVRSTEIFGDVPDSAAPSCLRVTGDMVELECELSRPLAEGTHVTLYVFGHRNGRSFAAMPHLRVRVGRLGATAWDGDRKLGRGVVRVTRERGRLRLQVGLDALGRPERLLFTARASTDDAPHDRTLWRAIKVPR